MVCTDNDFRGRYLFSSSLERMFCRLFLWIIGTILRNVSGSSDDVFVLCVLVHPIVEYKSTAINLNFIK